MLDFMKVRIITRDISLFPHRDLETIPLTTDLQVWWGDRPVPSGYVTVMDLGEQKLDFGGGLDLRSRSSDIYDTSLDTIESSPRAQTPRRTGRRAAHKKTTRKKAKGVSGAGRSRGRGRR